MDGIIARYTVKELFVIMFTTIFIGYGQGFAQISPGPLATVHTHLEGLSNCTKCHSLGSKVTNEKCLNCHTELKTRIDKGKGYHTSPDIKGKSCVSCHNDHHGLTFEILRFKKESFNHNVTGFLLKGAHSAKTCQDCHKTEYITDQSIKKKKFTYLGLDTRCKSCHTDYHQQTLSSSCSDCHGLESFKSAIKFNHASTRFPLAGKHQQTACADCHAVTTKNGYKFQEFAGVKYQHCTDCHTDIHQNKFGQNCTQCHTFESFRTLKTSTGFDHSRTNYPLQNKHQNLPCKSCHKNDFVVPLKHDRCVDCHTDYHEGQLARQGYVQDCSDCHSTKGFTNAFYTIEQHNNGNFKLQGAHLATPCITCHKKQEKWSFREIGIRCADCHQNIHNTYISEQYYPGSSCENCHSVFRWDTLNFDHVKTGFPLTGAHRNPSCRSCHYKKDLNGRDYQVFSKLTSECANCHEDIHFNQFDIEGKSECKRCHLTDQWKINSFDHNKTAFKLDGQHQQVPCSSCHKFIQRGMNTFVLYKLKDTRCESCH